MKDSVIAELAVKAQQGDMQAFEKLYTEFSPLVYSILLEITHDTYEAEDLTQDCFVSALKNIQSLKEPAKAKKWLTAIAANHGKDYLKKKKPALLAPEHEFIFEIQEEENASVLPEESAVLDERSEEIREIVNSVSEDKRLCLVLFYQHEMSITEIAEELGISESAVKSRLFRAREDIREEIEKRSKKGMPLFGIAPLPLILFALRKSSETASASFAGSAAQTALFTTVTATAGTTAATATVSTAAAVSTATTSAATTATATTGIGAKLAAMSVAQKVVAGVAAVSVATGSAVGTAAIIKGVTQDEPETTAYVEEITTAPDYGFEEETAFVPAVAQTETSTDLSSALTAENSISALSEKQTSSVSQTKTTQTATENKSTTRTQATTTNPTTTKPVTTKPVTTAKATTTKPVTTQKPTSQPTTTKPTTTSPPTTQGKATITVKVYSAGSGSEYENYTLTFDSGVTLSASDIETGLMNQYGIDAMADSFSVTTQPGGSYTATAYEI